jgi:hypothetical protein
MNVISFSSCKSISPQYDETHASSRVYLVISTFCFSILGYRQLFESLGVMSDDWHYNVPEVMYAMIYILSVVLCLAVGVMLAYHLWSIASGESSVEAQDHEEYRRKAKERGEASFWLLYLLQAYVLVRLLSIPTISVYGRKRNSFSTFGKMDTLYTPSYCRFV